MPPSAPPLERRLTGLVGTLRGAQLFAGLSGEDLVAIASFTQSTPLAKGAYLFRTGDPSRGCYLVQSGAVSVHRVGPTGKEQVIHVFRTGETFAEATLASTTGYPADARAVETSTVLLIPKGPILDLIGRRPDLALRMLGSMSAHLRVVVGMLDDLTLKDVESRLLHWLLRQQRAQASATVRLPGTKRVLAAELGTSSETLSRTLARLKADGLLAAAAHTVTLPDTDALAARLRRNLGER